MLRLIDNKKVNLTDDEFKIYENLCKSYDRPNFEGKSLFLDLFETDGDGMIIFLKPPGKKYISLEIVTFLQNIMVHQHLRRIYDEFDKSVKEQKQEMKILRDEIESMSKYIKKLPSPKKSSK